MLSFSTDQHAIEAAIASDNVDLSMGFAPRCT
jgi:hypothetical protein